MNIGDGAGRPESAVNGAAGPQGAFDLRLREGLARVAQVWAPGSAGGTRSAILDAARRRSLRRREMGVAGAVLVAVLAVVGVTGVGTSSRVTEAVGGSTRGSAAATARPAAPARLSPACVRVEVGAGPARCAGQLSAGGDLSTGAAGLAAPAAPAPTAASASSQPQSGAIGSGGSSASFGPAAASASGGSSEPALTIGEGQALTVNLPSLAGSVWSAPSVGPAPGSSTLTNGSAAQVARVVVVSRDRDTGVVQARVESVGPGTVRLQATAHAACQAMTGCGSARWRWTVTVSVVASGRG